MTPQEIKEQLLRMEGFADGIKNGAQMMAHWILTKFMEAEKAKAEEKKNGADV